jgi:hypothetical protein
MEADRQFRLFIALHPPKSDGRRHPRHRLRTVPTLFRTAASAMRHAANSTMIGSLRIRTRTIDHQRRKRTLAAFRTGSKLNTYLWTYSCVTLPPQRPQPHRDRGLSTSLKLVANLKLVSSRVSALREGMERYREVLRLCEFSQLRFLGFRYPLCAIPRISLRHRLVDLTGRNPRLLS